MLKTTSNQPHVTKNAAYGTIYGIFLDIYARTVYELGIWTLLSLLCKLSIYLHYNKGFLGAS